MKLSMKTLAVVILGLQGNISPIYSQFPCPPPEMFVPSGVVTTQEDCNCFYAFLGAGGVDPDDLSSLPEDSVLQYASTGDYVGPDNIFEYISFARNGTFVDRFERDDSTVVPHRVTGTTTGSCTFVSAELNYWNANPEFTEENKEVCLSTTTGVKVMYQLTGDPEQLILIQRQNIWISNKVITEFMPELTSSAASAEYVCDQIVNTCKDYSVDASNNNAKRMLKKGKKNSKASKSGLGMETCLQMYNELPDLTVGIDGITGYADGNSKACRILHSFLASIDDKHCPHISFEAEADINGEFKCDESGGVLQSELFTEEEIEFIISVGNTFGFDESGGSVTMEACPVLPSP